MNNLPVLIVGAGPTGLMMACTLARYGIDFRIIDKKPGPTLASNATWIQTRTIELFDQMGIADRFINTGCSCNAINLYVDGKPLSQFSLKHIDSIYPFILMLPQSKTEQLLENYLKEFNQQVARSVELMDIQYDDTMVTATLKNADGQTESIKCNWLIACDGANSIIREKCGFHFSGEDLAEQFMVADATINFSYLSKDEIHLFFDPGTVLAAFPLGENRYRLAANLHFGFPRKIFTAEEVIETVQERARGNYYVTDVTWISPFWIHGKIAERMRKGPIFLAGDAAHIHSPAGGQGMNTGMQDAYNLAWKLALVIKEKAKPSLLESYQIERYPVIQNVVEQNEYFTKLALFDDNFIGKLQKFSQALSAGQLTDIEKKFGNQLTQLDIDYQDSSIIHYKNYSPLLRPGQRAPDVHVNQNTLYDYLNNTQHNVLLFTGLNSTNDILEKINQLKKTLETQFSDLIKIYIVQKEPQANVDARIMDADYTIHNVYQVTKPAVYIIRPDTYISYVSEDLNDQLIKNFLHTYLR